MASSSKKRTRGKQVASSMDSAFKDRALIPPRYLSELFFSTDLPEVHSYLQRWKLLEFLSINEKVYPDLVKSFYSKLKFVDGCLITKVKGFPIRIDSALLTSITGLTFTGETLPGNGVAPSAWLMDFSVDNALMFLIGPSANRPGSRNLVGSCSLTIRVLHYILARALVPRSGNYAQLSHDDILLLWAMTHEREVNWGLLVCHHMMAMKNKANGMLPYGMLVTLILETFNIPLADDDVLPISHRWEIGAGTLAQMGYTKVDGSWVASGQAPHEDREDTPEPPAREDLRTQALMDYMQDQFQRLHTRFDFVDRSLQQLDSRVARLETFVPPPPPPSD